MSALPKLAVWAIRVVPTTRRNCIYQVLWEVVAYMTKAHTPYPIPVSIGPSSVMVMAIGPTIR